MPPAPLNENYDADRQPRDRPGRRLRWVGLLLLAGLAVVLTYVLRWPAGLDGEANGVHHPAVGRRLPELDLEPLTGAPPPVAAQDLVRRVTLINFWGTWCYPCVMEFPELATLAEQFGDQPDFQFLSVSCANVPPEQLQADTAAFLSQRGFRLPTWHDPGQRSRLAVAKLVGREGQFAYPTTLVLDRDGVVRGLWVGYAEGVVDEQRQLVGELLERTPAATAP